MIDVCEWALMSIWCKWEAWYLAIMPLATADTTAASGASAIYVLLNSFRFQFCLQQMLNCRSQTESIQITRKHIQESWIGLLIKNSLQIRNLLPNHKYILQSLWSDPHTCATHLQLFVRYEFVFRVYDVTIEKLSRYKISFIFLFFFSPSFCLFPHLFL